jgi:hypothetical protein
MSKNRSQRREEAKKAVLRDLELLAQDRHPRNQTLLARFARCGNFQKATTALVKALGEVGRWQKGRALSPPPGWLPPQT